MGTSSSPGLTASVMCKHLVSSRDSQSLSYCMKNSPAITVVILGSRHVLQDLLDKCHSLKFNTAQQWVWAVEKGISVLQQIKQND